MSATLSLLSGTPGDTLCENEAAFHQLQRSLSILKAEHEAAPDGILIVDENSQIISYNRRFRELWNMPEELIQTRDDEQLLRYVVSLMKNPEQFLERVLYLYDHPTETSQDEIEMADGRILERHSGPIISEENIHYGRIWFFRDVTERHQAAESLRLEIMERRRTEVEMERILTQSEQILSSISSILIAVDEQERITNWSTAARDAFGPTKEDVLGRPFQECGIQWNWGIVQEAAAKCNATHALVRLDDVPYLAPDGKERILGVTINPLNQRSDALKSFLLLAADITARKQMEQQLAQAQKLESIGQLAAGMAHEINTPIQYIGDNLRFLADSFQDLSALLRDYAALNPDAAEAADLDYLLEEMPTAFQQSEEGVERVAHLVRAMKEFSHPGGHEKTLVDLNHALESTIVVARNEWKYVADMETEFDPHLPPVCCLPAEINQVFLNVIVNAAHAIKDVVGDGGAGKGTIRVGTRSQDGWVEVRISDTGTGMPEHVRARIFDPFFTTKEVGRGTGQGLAISHSVVVEKHGGMILVETEMGQGTTFTIRLPLEKAA